jgi:hypothetical protein
VDPELIQAEGEILRSKIHKLIKSIWNKEELPDQWKESIIVPVHKKGDKTECSNYRGISLLSTSYKILSNILLSSLNLWEPPTVNIGALKRAVFHQMRKPLTTNTLALKRAVCCQLSPQLQCKL